MGQILVSERYWVRFDDEVHDLVAAYKWVVRTHGKHRYAVARVGERYLPMHRLIMAAPAGKVVDHIDGNGLNNERANLRLCTHAENLQNAGRRETPGRTSQYKGVWKVDQPCRRCFRAGITANRVYRNIGSYFTEEEAARAYDAEARQLHGLFARPNFPDATRPPM